MVLENLEKNPDETLCILNVTHCMQVTWANSIETLGELLYTKDELEDEFKQYRQEFLTLT